jgi:hypothetical protein
MTLPPADAEFLAERGIPYESAQDGAASCLVFTDWLLPGGYLVARSDLLIRLMPGYPDLAPDMWWFSPAVSVAGQIPGTDLSETYLGRNWQRWSRHFQPGQWQSGVDGIESFLALISCELDRWATAAA